MRTTVSESSQQSRRLSRSVCIALNAIDIVGEVASFIPHGAMLPVLLSFRGLHNGARRVLGDRDIRSSERHFVSSVSLLQWAISMGCRVDGRLCDLAVAGGHLPVLKWIHEMRSSGGLSPCDAYTVCVAARAGHLHMLRWLREELSPPCPWIGEIMCKSAAECGHLHVLMWLREGSSPPCPWDVSTCCHVAAAAGHLQVLQWICAKEMISRSNIIWDEFLCAQAARGGHLHVLKWLREEMVPPCPWDQRTCLGAIQGGHMEVLRWLREENDPPCPWGEKGGVDGEEDYEIYYDNDDSDNDNEYQQQSP